jgi:ubiquitin-protein ligase
MCPELLDIGERWAPIKNIVKIMFRIRYLLGAPNLQSAMNLRAADDFENGRWQAKAKE